MDIIIYIVPFHFPFYFAMTSSCIPFNYYFPAYNSSWQRTSEVVSTSLHFSE